MSEAISVSLKEKKKKVKAFSSEWACKAGVIHRYHTGNVLYTQEEGYTFRVVAVFVLLFILLTPFSSFSRCKCGGSRSLRRQRCTLGTSSDVCHSES